MPASRSCSYSSGSDEDPKAPIAKSRSKVIRDEGTNPSVPLNDRRVTFSELRKRKAEDDEKDARRRKKDRIRHKIQRAEEKSQFLDGVPSDSDADVLEKKPLGIYTEAEAEEDSDSDDDFYAHPDVTNSHESDSKEYDSEKDSDEDSEKDNDDESDNSDGSDEKLYFQSLFVFSI
ncbi:uncharacterized protein LOC113334615 [Papaver somniferum]|uniref:uncharacterized protein LOC113334615 n=1 Tax=Papaver somniferum TaxID=3469 RepID=UPI000E7013E9|nr:uncharacterized protein LOC113334615 [Papaver somniferum]